MRADKLAEQREELSALAHAQWSGWMRYLFNVCYKEGGEYVIPRWAAERWTRQMDTPYAALPDDEKGTDRIEADRVLELLARSLPDEADTHSHVILKDGAFICPDAQACPMLDSPAEPVADELNETRTCVTCGFAQQAIVHMHGGDDQPLRADGHRFAAQPADETPLRKVATMERDWDVLLSEICAAQLLMRNGDAAEALAELAKAEAHARLLAAQPIEQEKDREAEMNRYLDARESGAPFAAPIASPSTEPPEVTEG